MYKSKKTDFDFSEFDGFIPSDAMMEFIEHRKMLKKPLTAHAFALSMREALRASKLGMTPQQAIEETIQAGWQSINVEWIKARREMNMGRKNYYDISGNPGEPRF